MDRDEKLIRLQFELGKEQVKALDQLLLRQQAEYTAKGIKPGEDQETDEKFKNQKDDLQSEIRVRNKELQKLLDNDKVTEFEKKLDEPDPYNLNRINESKKAPTEPNAQSDYWKGLRWGYSLQHHDPQLADKIVSIANERDEIAEGIKDGQRQYMDDFDQTLQHDISPEIWDELDTNKGEIGHTRSKEHEKGKDIN